MSIRGRIVNAENCRRAQIRSKQSLDILSLGFYFDKVKVKRRKEVKKCKSDALLAKWFRLLPGISETNETKKVSNDLNVHNMKCCSVQEVKFFFKYKFSALSEIFEKADLSGDGSISIFEYIAVCDTLVFSSS